MYNANYKMPLKEINDLSKWKDILFMSEKTSYCWDGSIELPKLIYRFNTVLTILIKFTAGFFGESDRLCPRQSDGEREREGLDFFFKRRIPGNGT